MAYNGFLAPVSERILNLAEGADVTDLRVDERQVIVYRSDVPRGSSRPGVPAYDLTFNIVLLMTLFASSAQPWSNRNVGGFLLSTLILAASHVAALTIWILDLYASRFGPISAGYSDWERALWSHAIYFYRLVGQFALPLVLWWLMQPPPEAVQGETASVRGRKKKHARAG